MGGSTDLLGAEAAGVEKGLAAVVSKDDTSAQFTLKPLSTDGMATGQGRHSRDGRIDSLSKAASVQLGTLKAGRIVPSVLGKLAVNDQERLGAQVVFRVTVLKALEALFERTSSIIKTLV